MTDYLAQLAGDPADEATLLVPPLLDAAATTLLLGTLGMSLQRWPQAEVQALHKPAFQLLCTAAASANAAAAPANAAANATPRRAAATALALAVTGGPAGADIPGAADRHRRLCASRGHGRLRQRVPHGGRAALAATPWPVRREAADRGH